MAVLWRFDQDLYLALRSPDNEREQVIARAWYQFLRAIGYLPLWIALGLALLLQDGPWMRDVPRRRRWFGLRVVLSAGLSAGFSELIQPWIGRLRPNLTGGEHRYHGMPGVAADQISFGLPSSHAAVASGGAFMVMMLYPRAAIVALTLAVGCSWTRILQGGHFPSDVFASAIIGYAWARLLRPRLDA